MMERMFDALFFMIALITIMSMLPGSEISPLLGELSAYVCTIYFVLVLIPKYLHILRISEKAREFLLMAATTLGVIFMLATVGFIDPESENIPPLVYGIVLIVFVGFYAVKQIFIKYCGKKIKGSEEKNEVE